MIRLVNLLEHPSDGRVIVGGKDLTSLNPKELRAEKKKIGMIFQHFKSPNSKTVFDNIAMPLVLSGTPSKEIKERVGELLEFVGLSSKARSYPEQLSGGQKQRSGSREHWLQTHRSYYVMKLLQHWIHKPRVLFWQLLKKINKKYNITILLITHEMSVIREICNKVAVMEGGCVVEQGSVFEVFAKPQTDIAKNFVRTVIHDEIPQSFLKAQGPTSRLFGKLTLLGLLQALLYFQPSRRNMMCI